MPPPPRSLEELHEAASRPDDAVIESLASVDGPVVVAGAGGKMGYHLCRMLQRSFTASGKRNEVIAVSRFGDPEARAAFEAQGIRIHSADMTHADEVSDLPDAAAVWFLAGRKFGTGDDPEALRLFNEEMPSLVAQRYRGTPIVALSTGCVYPFVEPDSGGSRESDSLQPNGSYALSCIGRENAFLASSKHHATPLSLIRLNYSVDLRYGVLVDIASKVDRSEPVDVAMGYLNCIWQGDAIRYTLLAHERASSAPSPFVLNVTGEKTLAVRELAEAFGERLGKRVELSGTESDTAWLNDATKCHQLFGPPRIPEEVLIDWVADWIRNRRPLLGKPTHFEVRDGNY